jgi:RNA polymerase sigma factor (sigma-70 family)
VPPCVTFDDLASAGTVGPIQAVDRFDHMRGLKFKTYAQHRISGAMLDFLRSEDRLSRTERNRVRQSSGIGVAPVTVSLDVIALSRLAAPTQPAFTIRREVQTARQCLSPREDRVSALLFDLGWQNREVAAELRVNESRVSQIKQRAFKAPLSFVACRLDTGRTGGP